MHKSRAAAAAAAAAQQKHYGVSFDKMQISSRHDLVVIMPDNNGCHSVVMAEPYNPLLVCVLRGFLYN